MRSVIKQHSKQAEQRGFVRVASAWDAGEERICRGAPHVIVVHGDKDYGFGAEDGALALSYFELFAPTLGREHAGAAIFTRPSMRIPRCLKPWTCPLITEHLVR
jgi:hypothetical protein